MLRGSHVGSIPIHCAGRHQRGRVTKCVTEAKSEAAAPVGSKDPAAGSATHSTKVAPRLRLRPVVRRGIRPPHSRSRFPLPNQQTTPGNPVRRAPGVVCCPSRAGRHVRGSAWKECRPRRDGALRLPTCVRPWEAGWRRRPPRRAAAWEVVDRPPMNEPHIGAGHYPGRAVLRAARLAAHVQPHADHPAQRRRARTRRRRLRARRPAQATRRPGAARHRGDPGDPAA